MDLTAWCQHLPKLELHAHLHGCIRHDTLKKLMADKTNSVPQATSIDGCFQLFEVIHQTITSRDHLIRIVSEVVEDFVYENVRYLELRTTPRKFGFDFSHHDYVATIISVIERYEAQIKVRLLLSINRNNSVSNAADIVQLALKWKAMSRYVVGVDFSGNASGLDSKFIKLLPVLSTARDRGLKISAHFAEHPDEIEAQEILSFRPDRVGHACCLSEKLYRAMTDAQLPIEVCLTSNARTMQIFEYGSCGYKKLEKHPHGELIRNISETKYPICICTDDPGILDTSSTIEYIRASIAFGLTFQQLYRIARGSISMIFDESEVHALEQVFDEFSALHPSGSYV
uniref:Adenosine deaminaselike protein putative n=1 Tax=Albugo laibachii Nc14 TaxID=890382 RepID=F0X0B4_9STRA|nr:adenosine deaminaselike protein putative [Albugo laibachii Nc14]|eukprot:CCA27197.1 adenosine deaminaselike protein putative [Albugo laibachii Nc14]